MTATRRKQNMAEKRSKTRVGKLKLNKGSVKELSEAEAEKAKGGGIFQACCKGTHIPEVTIET